MIRYSQIPVLKRASGLLVTATPNGAWIEPDEDTRIFLQQVVVEDYRRFPPRKWMDATVSPVAGGLYIEWPGRSPLYLTHGEMQQVASAIAKLRAPVPAFMREAV